MLPSLEEFEINSSVFIRKLNNRNHWNGHEGNDLERISKLAVEKIFNYQDNQYCLWYVSNEQEFYGVIASLTVNANSKDDNIDFIWIYSNELEEVGIKFEQITEGTCLYVRDLHYEADIDQILAQKLCYNLMSKGRKAYRCLRAKTILVLNHQKEKGCKAADISSLICECEK